MNIINLLKKLKEPKINKNFMKNKKDKNEKKTLFKITLDFKKHGINSLKNMETNELYEIFKYNNNLHIKKNEILTEKENNNLKEYIIFKSNNYDSHLSKSFLNNY